MKSRSEACRQSATGNHTLVAGCRTGRDMMLDIRRPDAPLALKKPPVQSGLQLPRIVDIKLRFQKKIFA
jgi:hypothetical protein